MGWRPEQEDDSGTSAVTRRLPRMDMQLTTRIALLVASPSMLVDIERGETLSGGGSPKEVDRSTRAQSPLTTRSMSWERS